MIALAASLPLDATTFYVSQKGNASWTGRLAEPNPGHTDGPLPSLEAARDAVRAFRATGKNNEPTKVLIRDGVYILHKTIVFEPRDSGTEAGPIEYSAYPGEHPVFSGGEVMSDWFVTTNPGRWSNWILKPIWQTRLSANLDPAQVPRQVFVNGRRAQRSRTPNTGFLRILGPSSKANNFELPYQSGAILPSWVNTEAEIVVLMAWTAIRRQIIAVDETKHVATLLGKSSPFLAQDDARYYVENTPEGLDADGEWFYDQHRRVLHYWPLISEDLSKDEVVVSRLPTLVRLDGNPVEGKFVRYLTFQGLTFKHTNWYDGPKGFSDAIQGAVPVVAAFEAHGAEYVSIDRCEFRHLGGYGINFGVGSKYNSVLHTTIADAGAGGIKLGNFDCQISPWKTTLVNTEGELSHETSRLGSEVFKSILVNTEGELSHSNTISDNHIHHIGEVYPGAVGILVGQSSRNIISHNRIHDTYYTGISVGWTWGYEANQARGNIVEYNHLYNICRGRLNDVGAIYMLGVSPGTIIRNNLIHDVNPSLIKARALYLDEGASEMLVENNIIYRIASSGFHVHYGRNNIVRNNIFAFCGDFVLTRVRTELDQRCFTFENNIVLLDSGRLLGWTDRTEGLAFDHNLYFDVRGEPLRFVHETLAEWQQQGQDTHSLVTDPRFADPYSGNFTLRPDSPAGKIGFKNIDMSTVGPRP